jgi:hypothetical protein
MIVPDVIKHIRIGGLEYKAIAAFQMHVSMTLMFRKIESKVAEDSSI